MLGNTITGGASNWRFDHAIYMLDCPVDIGWTVEWNYIHGNDFARGPQISVNHQIPRCGLGSENKSVASHYIRNNTVDTTSYRGRCIGISAFGWQPENNNTMPNPTFIESNDLINCGYSGPENDQHGDARNGSAIYASEGGANISGNRLINSAGGIYIGSPKVLSSPEIFVDTLVEGNEIDDMTASEIGVAVGSNPRGEINIFGNTFGRVLSLQ